MSLSDLFDISDLGLTEFFRFPKGLTGVLCIGHIILVLFPWTAGYVVLVPAKTIPFVWNIITAGYIEQSLAELIGSILGLLVGAKLLEPMWTYKEFLKFVIFVNAFTLSGVYITAVASYFITGKERFLFMQLSGFHGVLAGFLVGVKQIMPDVAPFGLRSAWLPSLLVLLSIIASFTSLEAIGFLPFAIFGTYGGWLYLRYLQWNPETNLSGNPQDEFAFSTFFPHFFRPVIDAIASTLHSFLCGRTRPQRENSHLSDSHSVLAYNTAEAS
ncbi:hypothetical protein HHK36_010962 [Tetracentron sinense]|uniref:Rhomboid protein n=1 Tax=Tetracentron sinense TaxID=13715 RepID=A0A834ZBH4_TETSI|nr:hypothetical protein HHK36_010962 [Tetracentron sinense]